METHLFRDFDAFVSSVHDVDCTMLMNNPTHRRWSVSHLNLPEVHVQLGSLGSGNIVEGQSWSSGYLLYLPLTDACAYSANGIVISRGSFMVLEPSCEFLLNTKSEHDWCTVFVPTPGPSRGGSLSESSSDSDKATCRVTHPNLRVANRFRTLAGQVMTAATLCAEFESTPAARCAAAELLKVASSVVGGGRAVEPHRQGRRRLPRREIIRRCRGLLEERKGKSVLVAELAAAGEVSERTLRTVFNECFGVGPVRYLQLRRLHQVHRALRAAEPEAVSVCDTLARYGEWEIGRFASCYRRLFGERPSETLRRTG
jgi:AraC family ethanolamine operon transcriptional activator